MRTRCISILLAVAAAAVFVLAAPGTDSGDRTAAGTAIAAEPAQAGTVAMLAGSTFGTKRRACITRLPRGGKAALSNVPIRVSKKCKGMRKWIR